MKPSSRRRDSKELDEEWAATQTERLIRLYIHLSMAKTLTSDPRKESVPSLRQITFRNRLKKNFAQQACPSKLWKCFLVPFSRPRSEVSYSWNKLLPFKPHPTSSFLSSMRSSEQIRPQAESLAVKHVPFFLKQLIENPFASPKSALILTYLLHFRFSK